ncbi:hypothetical protein [Archangium lansingense]|uniref:Lipoprotein n=1 Tax=Archangium lansingense TaxID=2995310 RepID=A0ABT4AMQ2_9BACT|nr:hypothetical protein [Archangium lansinium]MCY1082963.1 hypothetical protein [Archangium lansinium]
MGRAAGLLLCFALSGCMTARSHVRYVPAEESAWFKFGEDLPEEGRIELSANRVAAMQLAMERFLPWNVRPSAGASRSDICVLQRQSWDVETAPGKEGTLLVRFSLAPGACYRGAPPLDMEATYEVDVRNKRLLERDPMQPPPELPREGRLRLEGNVAAAILLALADFLPSEARPPEGTRPEETCLYRPASHDVTAAPGPAGVVQVRFTVAEQACPTKALWGSSGALASMDRTVHAVDIRTMRILAVGSHAHLRPIAPVPIEGQQESEKPAAGAPLNDEHKVQPY